MGLGGHRSCAGTLTLTAVGEGYHGALLWQLWNDAEILQLPGPNLIRADLKMHFASHLNLSFWKVFRVKRRKQ